MTGIILTWHCKLLRTPDVHAKCLQCLSLHYICLFRPHQSSLARFWQVVDCRRILKWTYTYGYYTFGALTEGTSTSSVPKDVLAQHQEFFEFNQVRRDPAAGGIVSPGSAKQAAHAADS